MANTFIAVEGPHDVEFLAAIYESLGFRKISKINDLDAQFCRPFVPRNFPYIEDIYERVPVPMFLTNDNDWIAIRAAGGETAKLLPAIKNALEILKSTPGLLSAIGIVRDADADHANVQFSRFVADFQTILPSDGYQIELPASPGLISNSNPRVGIYVLPDNISEGALDDLVLECGSEVYPHLIERSKVHVDSINVETLQPKERKPIGKPQGKKKAIIACAANILKPGMAIANSLDQNRWLSESTFLLPRVASLKSFLQQLGGMA